MTWPDVPGLLFGGDYNPEQWPPQTWAEDIRLMRQARINLVTLGVFSWSVLEPSDGEFDFDWMESLLDDLHQARISVDLATATASPPPWLTSEHPDVLPVDRTGTVRWPGGRQAFCPHADDYRQRAVRIAGRLAERFGTHPAVVMWHVNNEYGCHTPACYCDHSAQAFREWLAQRYASLDALNDAWGTAVWSMRYADWTQIQPPRATPDGTAPQPGLVLDFHRFSSDSLLALFTAEKAAIREHDAVHPVTTNFMSMSHIYEMDYWTWAQHVDFVATDHYTIAASTKRHIDLAFQADRTRGWAGGRPWMLMEHAAGAVNWQPRNRTTSPGEMLRDAVSYLAHGADATLYFQFRAATAGSERFHSALLPHAGPNTERWRETVALGETIERLAELKGSVLHNQIAIVWDNESAWALRQPNLPTLDLDLEALAFEWYRALWRHGHGVDFVSPDDDLSGYRVVLVPLAYLFRPELGERLDECAHDGVQRTGSHGAGGYRYPCRVTVTPVPEQARRARAASRAVATAPTSQKDDALAAAADLLEAGSETVLAANALDVAAAEAAGIDAGLVDRLRLDEGRLASMASGLRQVIDLPDPVGVVVDAWDRPNGLHIERVRVPLGVVAIIYESRPNVTSDAAGLCLKSGNVAFLRGSSTAIESNMAIAGVIRRAYASVGLPEDALVLVEDTSREAAVEFMQQRDSIDCLIPRGGPSLIASILEHATVPFVIDGAGNCHVYVDAAADRDVAREILRNAGIPESKLTSKPTMLEAAEAAVALAK